MDPIMIEKLQAMKRYRRKRQFLSSLIKYLLTTLCPGLFLSCPLWLPCVCYYLKLIFAFLPNMTSLLFEPKWLFLFCNIIIVFLVSQSKLGKPSACIDMYEEYAEISKSIRGVCTTSRSKDKGSDWEMPLVHESKEDSEGMHGEEEDMEEEEEGGKEELNKRVEDFIARVNQQRRLEARMLAGYE